MPGYAGVARPERSRTSRDDALDDLREALTGLIEEFGVPRELTVTVAA